MSAVLSYCMNVHPGETLADLCALLTGPVRRVRASWRGDAPMGVGLWLPGAVAATLAHDRGAVAVVRDLLAAGGLFAYTANAFPIGGFHAARVKEEVYRPTWCDPARLRYTLDACAALAALLPEGARGSVSTAPVSYKSFGEGEQRAQAARALGEVALALARRLDETGVEVALALEPEPLALLETTSEARDFLRSHVFAGPGREVLVAAGFTRDAAEAALRRHVGVCLDTCHVACEFEHLPTALAALDEAGVRVVKAQLSSAPELSDPAHNAAGRRRLRAFDEPRYLHQSLALHGPSLPRRVLLRANDLDELLTPDAELRPAFVEAAVVRTHFHVPLSWEGDETLGTTRPLLEDALADLAAATDHLEVETYTFGVLPPAALAHYDHDPVNMIVEELRWADEALTAAGVALR